MKNKITKIYMAVTPDEYELPIYVSDTIEELSNVFGVTRAAIYSAISLNKSGSRRGCKFVKVRCEEKIDA